MCGGGFTRPVGQGEDTWASFAAVDMPEPITMANCIQHWTREKRLPGDIANACCSVLLLIRMVLWMCEDLRETVHCSNKQLLKSHLKRDGDLNT